MSDIAQLGFSVNTRGLVSGERALDGFARKGQTTERSISKSTKGMNDGFSSLTKVIGAVGLALTSVGGLSVVTKTIFSFDGAMKGLQATTRATTETMAQFEKQARLLGATSQFSATQAAEAQRFLAMAGFSTNEILTATPAILNLATAAQLSLAESADIASNVLGGLQLPVSQLNRVIDVLAETSASANTDVKQLAVALRNSAPIATAAGVEIEELAAIIGALSDSGVQAERAGTGVVGIIRQLSNISPRAKEALLEQGISTDQLSISSRGLTAVLQTLNTANLDAESAIALFGSEAAAAGLIASAFSDNIEVMTQKYKGAAGAADEMSKVIGSSLTVAMLGLGSAISEASLQIGDAGLSGAMGSAMLASTAFIHVFTGMLPEFAKANDLTADYVDTLTGLADIATITAGALGSLAVVILTSAIATGTLSLATKALNVVMAANPIVLVVGTLALLTGALFAARNMTVGFGDETVKVRDIASGAFNAIADAFGFITSGAKTAFNAVSGFFTGLTGGADESTSTVNLSFTKLFTDINDLSKVFINTVIATFVTIGKTVGIVASAIFSSFSNMFGSTLSVGKAFFKDLKSILSGDLDFDNFINAVNTGFIDPLGEALSEIKEAGSEAFATDFIGDAANKLGDYVLASKSAREAVEAQKEEEAALKKTLEEKDDVLQKAIKADAELAAKSDAMSKSFLEQNQAIADQIIQLRLGADAFEIYAAKMEAMQNGVTDPAQLAQLEQRIKLLQETRNLVEQIEKDEADAAKANESNLDSITASLDNFGGAWTRTGSIIVDAFGNIADAINDYTKKTGELASIQEKISADREKDGADKIALDKQQGKLDTELALNEISGMRSVAAVGQSLFDEKTAAAKAFGALNQALAIVEIALSFKKMTASTAEAGVHVANETTKQGANALTAITSAFSYAPPLGFVMGAAMIGIMASLLGGAFGGGGSVVDPTEELQESQGTGTLLGSDDKSNSILNSQDEFNDLQINQLFELRGIRNSITALSDGISKLAQSFSASTGALTFQGQLDASRSFAGFSSTKQSVIDNGIAFVGQTLGEIIDSGILEAQSYFTVRTKKSSWFGLSKSDRTADEFQNIDGAIQEQMANIFGFIGESVLESARLLGIETVARLQSNFVGPLNQFDFYEFTQGLSGAFADTFDIVQVDLEEALSGFQIDIGKVSFEGLSGDEIEAELQAIFSQQGDLIAEFLVPGVKDFQQVGEGLFETLTRVAREQVIFNDQIKTMGFDLSGVSKIIQLEFAQSIISLVGGIEQFTELTTQYIDNFFSEQEKFEILQNSLSEVFTQLGKPLVSTTEEFRALVEGLDITTQGGQETLAALLELSPAMAEYIEALEDERIAREDSARSAFGILEQSIKLEKQSAQAVLDGATDAYNAEILRINGLRDALDDEQALRQDAYDKSETALIASFAAQNQAIELEKQRAKVVLDSARTILDAELLRINGLRSSLDAEKALREGSVTNAIQGLRESFAAQNQAIELEKQRAQVVLNSAKTMLDAELSRIAILRTSLDAEKALREQNVNDATSLLNEAFAAEIALIQSNASVEMELIKSNASAEIALIQSNASARIDALNSERGALDSTASSMQSLIESLDSATGIGGTSLMQALTMARGGDFSGAQSLDSSNLVNQDATGFASASDLAISNALNQNRLAAISLLAGEELSETQSLINTIDRQIEAEQLSADRQVELLQSNTEKQIKAEQLSADRQVVALTEQLNSLLGIVDNTLLISEAIVQFKAAQSSLADLNFDNQVQSFALLIQSANDGYSLAEQNYSDSIQRLDGLIDANNAQLNSLLGIVDNTLSISEAITQLNDSQTALADLNFDSQVESFNALIQAANDDYSLAEQSYNDTIESFDDLIAANNEQLDSLLGIVDNTLSIKDATLQFNAAKLSLDLLNYEEQSAQFDMLITSADEVYQLHQSAYENELTRLDGILDYNEQLLNVALGIDNSIVSVGDAVNALNSAIAAIPAQQQQIAQNNANTENQALKQEITQMREDNAAYNREVVKNTKSTASILQRLEFNGFETRAEQ